MAGAIEHLVKRPPELAQDDTPMIAAVQHALVHIPGPPEQIIVLLQPTAVFRKPEHVQQAIALLQTSGADSVVSLVRLPDTHSPQFACQIDAQKGVLHWSGASLALQPPCRQQAAWAYRRDGTVYACWRKTVEQYGNLYGALVRPLIIPPDESCELDTEADWADVERRWQHGQD